jgi:hypothetical protein
MTDYQSPNLCSLCGTALEEGFLSYCSGAIWHRTKPRGWRRAFWSAYSSGERVFGSFASSPVVSSVPAFRCPSCAAVVIPGKSSGGNITAKTEGAA